MVESRRLLIFHKRKLATVQVIKTVEPIENADSIVKLTFESMG